MFEVVKQLVSFFLHEIFTDIAGVAREDLADVVQHNGYQFRVLSLLCVIASGIRRVCAVWHATWVFRSLCAVWLWWLWATRIIWSLCAVWLWWLWATRIIWSLCAVWLGGWSWWYWGEFQEVIYELNSALTEQT